MSSKNQIATLDVYAGLMEEIKVRISAIQALSTGSTGLIVPLARESCFLQLRMICELMALGCLVAHGDLSVKKTALHTKYQADFIMNELLKIHNDFYPHPVTVTTMPDKSAHLEDIKDGYLTRSELTKLYAQCGGNLHKGSFKRLLSEHKPDQGKQDFAEIVNWTNKIIRLLNNHRIALLDKKSLYLCSLKNTLTGRVQVAFAQPV